MTDLQYGILGLIALAVFVNRQRLADLVRPAQAAAPTPLAPIVRLSEPQPTPIDPQTLAGLLHQQIQTKGQLRAIERHVETMVEGEAGKVTLAFASPANPAPNPGTDAPKS